MNYKDNLNSTKKLLNIIRGKQTGNEEEVPVSKVSRHNLSIKRGVKKRQTCGVFFGLTHVSMVLVGDCGSGDERELVKWEYLPIPAMVERSDPQFVSFLRTALKDFLGEHQKVDLWSCIDSKDLKLRNVLIPDLPPSKIANAAFWALKKEVDLDGDKEVFDYHTLDLVQSSGVNKRNVFAFSGAKAEIKALDKLFASAGYPLAGITATPFFLQNFIRTGLAAKGEGLEVIVKISRYYTEIICFYYAAVQLVRIIRTGSNSLVEDLEGKLADEPVLKSRNVPEILSLASDPESDLFEAMESGVDRIVNKVIMTGNYCSNNYVSNEPVSRYLFFGETDNCLLFKEHAEKNISAETSLLNPFEKHPDLTIGTRLPEGGAERCGILSALGIALSDRDHTPDFLNTYIQRDARAKFKRMNLAISGVCVAALLLLSGVWWWQHQAQVREIAEKDQIMAQVDKYIPQVDQPLLDKTLKQAGDQVTKMSAYGSDLLPVAVINELCTLTPDSISLLSFEADFKKDQQGQALQASKKNKQSRDKEKQERQSVLVKGVVTADYTSLESTLTAYVVRIGDSILFGEIMVLTKTIEKIGEKSVLSFTADMEIL